MDSRVRALDIRTGEVIWKALVSAPAVALAAIHEHHGKQFVVFVARGNSMLTPEVSDEVVAFSLSQARWRNPSGSGLRSAFKVSGPTAFTAGRFTFGTLDRTSGTNAGRRAESFVKAA